MAVGTNIGNVYKSSEGFGKSAILPQQQNAFAKESVIAQNALNPKTPVVEKNAIRKELKDDKAEWWIAHNADLEKEFNTLLDYGADIMEQNVDPTKNPSDKAAADWQKRWAKLENAAKLSMQAKEDFEAFKAVADKEPDKYTDESLAERYAFHARPFSEMKEDYGTPPRLVSKQAPYEYTKNLQTQAENFKKTNPNYKNEPESVKQNVLIALTDETMKNGIIDGLQPRMAKLGAGQRVKLQQLANTNGFKTPEEYLYYQDIKSQLGDKEEPFDLNKFVKETMPGYDIYGRTSEVDGTTTSVKDKRIPEKDARIQAELMFESFPNLLTQMQSSGSAKDKASAIDLLTKRYLSESDREHVTSTLLDEEGYAGSGLGKEEYDTDRRLYDEVVRMQLDTFDGKTLTEDEKEYLRNTAGSYINGVKFEGGEIIDLDADKGFKTMDVDFKKGGRNAVAIYVKKKVGSESTSTRKGNETTSKTKDNYEVEGKNYTLSDDKKETHLQTGITQQVYNGGLKLRGEKFEAAMRRALEDYQAVQKLKRAGANEKIRAQQAKIEGKTYTPPSTAEKLSGVNLENPNE